LRSSQIFLDSATSKSVRGVSLRAGSNFGPDDSALLKAMAEDEANIGNTTGSTMFKSIAERMDDISSRSLSRMSAAMSVKADRSPSPRSESPDSEDSDDNDEEEVKTWVFSNERCGTCRLIVIIFVMSLCWCHNQSQLLQF